MSGKKKVEEDQEGQCLQAINNNNLQEIGFQDQLLFHQQILQHQCDDVYGGGSRSSNTRPLIFPTEFSVSPILQPWTLPVPSFNTTGHFDQVRDPQLDPFVVPHPLQSSTSSSYASFFQRKVPYEGPSSSSASHDHNHLRFLSEALGPIVQPGSAPFPFGLQLQPELGKMTAQEIMDAKALAASKSHSEAERRRRERINNHLARLRSLLPSTTKTDKASLLAEVIQHVKELKRQTSLIAETTSIPTELDELIVDTSDVDGEFVIKASLCCEDRSDLLPDLIKTLKALRLRTLKAEITTLGGRAKNVLFVTGEEDCNSNSSATSSGEQQGYCITSIQEALKAVMEKSGSGDSSSFNVKRQRTSNINMNP